MAYIQPQDLMNSWIIATVLATKLFQLFNHGHTYLLMESIPSCLFVCVIESPTVGARFQFSKRANYGDKSREFEIILRRL